jgi:hypothetical protein
MPPPQENSISADYVTEKLFEAFAGGCVPVYLGAPNIEAFLPDPDAIVDMRCGSTPCARTPGDHACPPPKVCCPGLSVCGAQPG